jgi:short-subunit dehydrogenase
VTTPSPTPQREPELAGQTVVVIGGSAGIGFETARRARTEGAEVNLTGRNPDRLERAALELGAKRSMAIDANDSAALERFFQEVPAPIDHVLVTVGGPRYGPLLDMDKDDVQHALSEHVVVALHVARNAVGKMRPGGTLLLMGGTGGRRISRALGIASAATAVLPPFTAALALELALFASTSSQPASWTRHCRRRFSATGSRLATKSCARHCPSAGWWVRPTSRLSPSTS